MASKVAIVMTLDSSGFTDGLKEANAQLKKSAKDFEEQFGKMTKYAEDTSKKMMGLGAAILAGFGAAFAAAEKESANMEGLAQVIENVGVSYDGVKDSLEALMATTQQKTGVTDSQQRDALKELILVTGDYKTALDLLPLALDLAAAKEMDVATAAEKIGQAAIGNIEPLKQYGIVMDENTTSAEALSQLQDKVTGSAEASASQITILKGELTNLVEAIGSAVTPTITDMIEKLTSVIEKIQVWIEANPKLMENLLKFGAILVGAGGLIFAFVKIVKAIQAINTALIIMQGLSGPAGWATLAGGVIAIAGTIAAISAITSGGETTAADVQAQIDALNARYEAGEITFEELYAQSEALNSQYADLPSYGSGGIVPGAPGEPQLAIVHGGEEFSGVGNSLGGTNLNINIGTLVGDDVSVRNLAREVKKYIQEDNRRNSFGQTNNGYYYGRSSI